LRSDCASGTDGTRRPLGAGIPFGASCAINTVCASRPRVTGITLGANQSAIRPNPLAEFINDKVIGDADCAWGDVAINLFGFTRLQGVGDATGGNRKAWRHFAVAIDGQTQFYLIAAE
jgi:hypothetical protein